jgi:hypothetical protein
VFRRWIGSHKSLVVTATGGFVVAALVATIAIVSNGYTAQHLELDDGSVWVANGNSQVIGRANTQVMELNTVVASAGKNLHVVQRGSTVLLFDESSSKVDIVDPATSKVTDSVPLPPAAPELFLAGDNVVIHSGGTGEVWITPISSLASFNVESQPTLSLGAKSVATVTPDGVLYAYSADTHQIYRLDAANSDAVDESHPAVLGGADSRITVTSVGGQPVLLDSASRTMLIGGRSVDLSKLIPADGVPVLQRATTDGTDVLVAYSGGLVDVPLSGGAPRSLLSGRSGFPAAPASVADCSYAAWSDGTAWKQCGDATAERLSLDRVPASASGLEFVADGGRVVLNDPRGGGTWAVQRGGQLIDNWADLIVVKQDQQQVQQQDEDTPPEYDKTQVPPVAVDDSFGARPGKSTVLPVLLNDYDPNGDVLVITETTGIDPAIGRLDLINNQQQIQLTLVAGVTAPIVFRYTISDGRGGTASATVTVTVRTLSENSPPEQVRHTKAIVVQGGRVTTNVLGDWIDPDGDAFYLTGATTAAPDTVSYKPDGTVVFSEGGSTSELRTVLLTMSDGTATGTGTITITVKPAGKVPIIPDPFGVQSYAGQTVTIAPLDHVRGGTGQLRLSSVPAKTGVTIVPSLETGTFTFASTEVGTHYLEYVVNDGDQTATGIVRVDVAAPPDANTKPITIPKTVFVKTLSSETVDVASTDIDPAGGVLLVTGVSTVPAGSGVRAEVLEQKSIRVSLTAPLESGPVSFTYRITNGLADAQGVVTVVEIPVPPRLQPPIANDDSVTVRVGDAIDIPVLANDVQPDGEELTLNPQLSTTLNGDSGLLFASGKILRYLAPAKTGNFTAVYQISGPDGQTAQAQVHIAVREAVVSTNNPPVPVTAIGRVIAGGTVRIRIPLSGIDPDGDSVQLIGQASSPQKGSVTAVGTDYFDYEAGTYSAGTDSFDYSVIDALGARATGTVRVGISPKVDGARNPVAVADEVRMRPGGTVSVQVLANDSDPDGSALKVTRVQPNSKDTKAKIVGDIVKVTPPKKPGRYGLVYTIENSFGGTSSNFITVVVDPDAPPSYPVAGDTVLTLTDILGRDSVDVDVLKNVFFADGDARQLKVSLLPGYGGSVEIVSGKRLHVPIEQKSQIIPFAVTNPLDSHVVSYAFVWVPGLRDALPQLNRTAPALTIPSESTLTIDLDDYVVAVGGKRVRLTDTSTVQATHANGGNLVVNDHTLRFTSADKYFGPASLSFEVTDGSSATDPTGRKATLVLPITVTPRENQPPVFNGGVIEFEPGQSKDLDLLKLTTYPYPKDVDELAYTVLNPLPQGFSYSLTGQKLTIRANDDAVKGSVTSITLGVRDAIAAGKAGRIELDVVASGRPLARPAPDSVVAPRGQTTTVDVLANDEATNPFPGKPLRVLAIRGLDGSAVPAGVSIVPSANNSRLSITVDGSALPGDTNLQYQVADVTNDPDRYVWGSIRISVQDKPDTPQAPVRASGGFEEGLVTLSLKAPQFNNSPITKYEVRSSSHGDYVKDCGLSQRCVLTDLTPGLTYKFTLVVSNGQGASQPSPPSVDLSADYLPAAPATVTAAPSTTTPAALDISWAAVADPNPGSAVIGYTVLVTGPNVNYSKDVSGVTTSTPAGLLAPNQQYTVSVYARNSAKVLSDADWRRTTTTARAVGAPLAPSPAPTAAVNGANANGEVLVTWGAANPNGAGSVTYSVGRFDGSAAAPSCVTGGTKPGQLSGASVASGWVDTTAADGQTYTYMVYADNGFFCTATATGPVQSLKPPGTASGTLKVVQNGDSGQWDLQLSEFSVSSGTATKYQYQLNSGAWTDVTSGTFITSAGNASVYGNANTVTLRGCRDTSENYCGTPSAPQSAVPFTTRAAVASCISGQPPQPTVPSNGPAVTAVSYAFAYDDGALLGGFGPYSYSVSDNTPPPAPLGSGIVNARVKATVTVGGTTYTDPGFGTAPNPCG